MVKVLFAFFLLLPWQCLAEVRLIEVKHRAAVDLAPQVRELLEEGEKVEAAGDHLILIANGESLQAAEQMIALLDTAQLNLLIRVRQSQELQQAGKTHSSSTLYSTRSKQSDNPGSGYRLSNTAKSQEQTLYVIEGGKGLIEIGREVPYTEHWAAMIGRIAGYSEKISYQTIATGFLVYPVQVVGDKVLVDIEPYIADADSTAVRAAPQINYSQLRTRLQVPIGQWYPLGSQLSYRDTLSRSIISWQSSDGQPDRELQIRIDLND